MDDKPKGTMQMIDSLPPRLAFWAGVVVSAGVIFAIGFIVMLVMMFKGVDFPTKSSTNKNTTTTANSNSNTNTVTTDTTGTPSGTIALDSLRNVRGDGDLTIVEYSDIDCPFCVRFHPTMKQVVEENYAGKVRWAYKHLPLTSLHPNAKKKAIASECAADQGKFWEYIDSIVDNTATDTDEITSSAEAVGLDMTKFNDCYNNEETVDRITEDSAEAQKFGARGTPYALVIDKDGNIVDVIEGALPYDSVAAVLDSHL